MKLIPIFSMFLMVFQVAIRVASSQTVPVYQAWVTRYNGPENDEDYVQELVVDGSGNIYVTGQSNDDFLTIKYDPSGVEQWAARYNGIGDSSDYPYALAVDGLGNVYVAGASWGAGTSGDFAAVKYDRFGNELWVARYDGPGHTYDAAYGLGLDVSGNVYVSGYSTGSGTFSDFVTIKYDASGHELWSQRYNRSGKSDDVVNKLAVDGSGNTYATGQSDEDYATIKYNSSGEEQWFALYNGPGNGVDIVWAIKVDGAGNVYVTGESNSDYATIKYDASGNQLWVARYDGMGNGSDVAWALAVDGSGNVYVTGKSNSDYATIKYDAAGNEQWVARYNGPANSEDNARAIAVDALGNVYVTGKSIGRGSSYDYATIKYDASGHEQWVERYDGPGDEEDNAYSIGLDEAGNVYVTGGSEGEGSGDDYATIRYQESPIFMTLTLSSQSGTGTFDYAVKLTNITGSDLTEDIWTDFSGPGGFSKVGRITYDKPFEAGLPYSITKSTSLGPSAPPGDYLFTAKVGDYPGVVLGYGSATYTKTTLEKGGAVTETFPSRVTLFQNQPNPFNPSTNIRYGLPMNTHVRLELFNVLGQSVALLVDEDQQAGYHQTTVGRSSLGSGVYFYRLQAGDYAETKRFMVLK